MAGFYPSAVDATHLALPAMQRQLTDLQLVVNNLFAMVQSQTVMTTLIATKLSAGVLGTQQPPLPEVPHIPIVPRAASPAPSTRPCSADSEPIQKNCSKCHKSFSPLNKKWKTCDACHMEPKGPQPLRRGMVRCSGTGSKSCLKQVSSSSTSGLCHDCWWSSHTKCVFCPNTLRTAEESSVCGRCRNRFRCWHSQSGANGWQMTAQNGQVGRLYKRGARFEASLDQEKAQTMLLEYQEYVQIRVQDESKQRGAAANRRLLRSEEASKARESALEKFQSGQMVEFLPSEQQIVRSSAGDGLDSEIKARTPSPTVVVQGSFVSVKTQKTTPKGFSSIPHSRDAAPYGASKLEVSSLEFPVNSGLEHSMNLLRSVPLNSLPAPPSALLPQEESFKRSRPSAAVEIRKPATPPPVQEVFKPIVPPPTQEVRSKPSTPAPAHEPSTIKITKPSTPPTQEVTSKPSRVVDSPPLFSDSSDDEFMDATAPTITPPPRKVTFKTLSSEAPPFIPKCEPSLFPRREDGSMIFSTDLPEALPEPQQELRTKSRPAQKVVKTEPAFESVDFRLKEKLTPTPKPTLKETPPAPKPKETLPPTPKPKETPPPTPKPKETLPPQSKPTTSTKSKKKTVQPIPPCKAYKVNTIKGFPVVSNKDCVLIPRFVRNMMVCELHGPLK